MMFFQGRSLDMHPGYPQDAQGWRDLIERELNIKESEGRSAHKAGIFPYETLEVWIKSKFSDGYHPSFVPALLRNILGFVNWVYGSGKEPSWPGSDENGLDKKRMI
jgi:hypothetical protein